MHFIFAWRYFWSKKSLNAINIIAWISVLAITVGTAALIIVLSVFNGFEGLVKGLYGDFYADIRIVPSTGKFFQFTNEQLINLKKIEGISKSSFTVEEKAVLLNGDYQTIVYLKGVDSNFKYVNNLTQHIERGKFSLGFADAPELVIGAGIENAIGADPQLNLLPLTIYIPDRKATSFSSDEAMHSYNATTAGTFMVQQEFDNKYAFTNLPFLQYMLDLKPNEYSAIELKTTTNGDEDILQLKQIIEKIVGKDFIVQTRYEQNQSLYTIMEIEKWIVYGVLCLILAVAAFNVIGALTMLVLEKQKDIAVLKAMGMNNNSIRKLFLYEGFVLTTMGGGIGTLIAIIACLVQQKFKIIKLQGGTFVIDHYPVKMLPKDFLLVICTVMLVTILAAWFPSRKAANQFYSLKS